jgi:hypothetical protein
MVWFVILSAAKDLLLPLSFFLVCHSRKESAFQKQGLLPQRVPVEAQEVVPASDRLMGGL